MRSCVSYSIWRCNFPRRLTTPLQQKRSFSQAKARFVAINEKGIPSSFETEIRVGHPHQAFIYIDPTLGDLIRAAFAQRKTEFENDLKKLPIAFHHTSRHFSLRDVPYPRVEIDQDLPCQTLADMSPATLWTSFNWHALTLDGSPEEEFERLSRESGEDWKELLEMLSRT